MECVMLLASKSADSFPGVLKYQESARALMA